MESLDLRFRPQLKSDSRRDAHFADGLPQRMQLSSRQQHSRLVQQRLAESRLPKHRRRRNAELLQPPKRAARKPEMLIHPGCLAGFTLELTANRRYANRAILYARRASPQRQAHRAAFSTVYASFPSRSAK